MKKNYLLFAIGAILITLSSCKKSDAGSSTVPTTIPWMAVGHQWVYAYTPLLSSDTSYTLRIISNTNGVYTGVVTLSPSGDSTYTYIYGENGYACSYDEGDTKKANQQIMKLTNEVVGSMWTNITPSDTDYHTIVNADTVITTTAGTFHCTKVQVTFANAFNTQYSYWNAQYGEIFVDDLLAGLSLRSKNF